MLYKQGGLILFGVTPDGMVSGLQVSDKTIEWVSEQIARIDPPACPAIERIAMG